MELDTGRRRSRRGRLKTSGNNRAVTLSPFFLVQDSRFKDSAPGRYYFSYIYRTKCEESGDSGEESGAYCEEFGVYCE